MAIKKAQYNVKTESGFDTYHFETSESQIIYQIQQLSTTGYRVHPGGLIEQWGEVDITVPIRGLGSTNITFPVSFPTKCVFASTNVTKRADTGSTSFVDCINSNFAIPTTNGGAIIARNIDVSLTAATKFTVSWRALGY